MQSTARARRLVVGMVICGVLAACGGAAATSADATDVPSASPGVAGATPPFDTAVGGAAGTCLPNTPDCTDTLTPLPGEEYPSELVRETARQLLGTPEDELPDTIRVARRGGETFALTEDYVVGRMTVELDRSGGGGPYEVTSVTVEMPNGPEAFPTG